MTLTETVMASLVFSLTAAASVHLLSLVSGSVLDLERRQQRLDQLEAALVASESLLRSESRQLAPSGDCRQAAGRLLLLLQATSPRTGLSQDLSLTASGEMLQVRLAAAGLGLTRQRIYHPATFGLCPPLSSQEVARGPS